MTTESTTLFVYVPLGENKSAARAFGGFFEMTDCRKSAPPHERYRWSFNGPVYVSAYGSTPVEAEANGLKALLESALRSIAECLTNIKHLEHIAGEISKLTVPPEEEG